MLHDRLLCDVLPRCFFLGRLDRKKRNAELVEVEAEEDIGLELRLPSAFRLGSNLRGTMAHHSSHQVALTMARQSMTHWTLLNFDWRDRSLLSVLAVGFNDHVKIAGPEEDSDDEAEPVDNEKDEIGLAVQSMQPAMRKRLKEDTLPDFHPKSESEDSDEAMDRWFQEESGSNCSSDSEQATFKQFNKSFRMLCPTSAHAKVSKQDIRHGYKVMFDKLEVGRMTSFIGGVTVACRIHGGKCRRIYPHGKIERDEISIDWLLKTINLKGKARLTFKKHMQLLP